MKQKDMCKLLGLKGESSYSLRENGKRAFSQIEIEMIATSFNLTGDQIKDIFFSPQLTINSNLNILQEEAAI